MEIITKNEPMVRISYDEMEAFLLLPMIEPEATYDVDEVFNFIHKRRVRFGVMEDVVREMIDNRVFGQEVLFAKGTEPVDGEEAYFEYNFQTKYSYTPEVDENGDIPYSTLTTVAYVVKGQEIAKYTPHIPGENGRTVTGKNLSCKRGRPLASLIGTGFHLSKDRRVYTADVTGRIEQNKNRISIIPVTEVFSDIDGQKGRVDFKDDVLIHGNVLEGAVVYSAGAIIIEGMAKGCRLEAKRDIIVREGIYGDRSLEILSKKNIVSKRIENATIFADGFVLTTYCENSLVSSNDRIYILGRDSRLIGGEIFAYGGIVCENMGSETAVTTACAGIHKHIFTEFYLIEQRIYESMSIIDSIDAGLESCVGDDPEVKQHRAALLKSKIEKQADIVSAKMELERIKGYIENKQVAAIEVKESLCPLVHIEIDELKTDIKEKINAIRFRRDENRIVYEQLE